MQASFQLALYEPSFFRLYIAVRADSFPEKAGQVLVLRPGGRAHQQFSIAIIIFFAFVAASASELQSVLARDSLCLCLCEPGKHLIQC